MSDTTPRPGAAPRAQLTERFWVDSGDGPLEHRETGCLSGHWRTRPPETIHRHWPRALS
jgi:hypothetical protein